MASVSSSFYSLSSSPSIVPNSIGKVKKAAGQFSTASCAITGSHPRPISAVCTATVAPETVSVGSGPALSSATASFYEVLGVQAGATCQEIKAAYRRLARVVHPDVAGNGQREDNCALADQFIRAHEAYSTLSDPEKRADYDRDFYTASFDDERVAVWCCNCWERSSPADFFWVPKTHKADMGD